MCLCREGTCVEKGKRIWSEKNELQKICSISNSITFYRSPGMRSQVEAQKERSQLTSIHKNSMYNLLRGGSENNELQKIRSKSNSITFYRSPGMRNQVERQKGRFQGTSIHDNSRGGGGSENNVLCSGTNEPALDQSRAVF